MNIHAHLSTELLRSLAISASSLSLLLGSLWATLRITFRRGEA